MSVDMKGKVTRTGKCSSFHFRCSVHSGLFAFTSLTARSGRSANQQGRGLKKLRRWKQDRPLSALAKLTDWTFRS